MSSIDFEGFRQGSLVVAVLFAVAGLISWLGIRNEQHDARRVSVASTAGCHDRATPPPAYADRGPR